MLAAALLGLALTANPLGPVDVALPATPTATATATGFAAGDVEVDPDLEPRTAGGIRAQASIEIDASPDVVRDEILDLQARVDEGWLVDSVSVYRNQVTDESIDRRAKWSLSVLGIEIVYSTVYRWRRDLGTITWHLDPSRDNDLTHAEGVYRLVSRRNGAATRLEYVVEVGTKHRAARPFKRSLTVRNIKKLLESVKRRSESK